MSFHHAGHWANRALNAALPPLPPCTQNVTLQTWKKCRNRLNTLRHDPCVTIR